MRERREIFQYSLEIYYDFLNEPFGFHFPLKKRFNQGSNGLRNRKEQRS